MFSQVCLTKVVPNHVFYVVFFKFDAEGVFEPLLCAFFLFVSLCWCFVASLGTLGALCGQNLVFLRSSMDFQGPPMEPCAGPCRGGPL